MSVANLLMVPHLDEHRARIEEELRLSVSSSDPFLTEVATHLITAGGSRWRPTLTVLAALAGGAEVTPEVIRGACAVELVHLGSLYHDDVMDEADSRRGVASVNARWGNLVAILAGDYLLARASELASSLGAEVAALLAQTIARLCEGQVMELRHMFQSERTEEAYFSAIKGKTAALFATACRIGGTCACLPEDQVRTLTEFGAAFGVLFQILDDINDLSLTDDELGKPAGHDLIEGVYTLPVLRALAMPEVGDELRPLLTRTTGRPEANKARQIVRSSGAIASSSATARSWAQRAAETLRSFPAAETPDALRNLGYALLDGVG